MIKKSHLYKTLSTIKFGLMLCFLLEFHPLKANPCDLLEKEMQPEFNKLQALIIQESAGEAYKLADSLLQVFSGKKGNDCEMGLWIRFHKAEAVEMSLKFEDALQQYYTIILDAERKEQWDIVAQSHLAIARSHERIQRSQDCLRHLNLALEIIKAHHLVGEESVYAVRYASYHRIFDNKDTAMVYAKMAVELGEKAGVLRSQYDGYFLMASLEKDIQTSIKYYKISAKLFAENKNYLGASYMYLNVAKRMLQMEQHENMMIYLDSIQKYAQLISFKNEEYNLIMSYICDLKKSYFIKNKMPDSASFYQTLQSDYRTKSQWFADQLKVESNAVEFAIEKEKEKVKHEQQISLILRLGLAGTGFLLLLLTWALYNNQKKQKQITLQNQTIISKNDSLNKSIQKQAVLLSEIHHRVKNNLQVIISLLALESTKLKNPDVVSLLEEIGSKVKSIALIHDQLYSSGDFEKINLKNYLNELCNHFQEFQSENYNFDFEIDCEDVHLNLETVFPLGIICTELIGNSLKYGKVKDQKLKIDISLQPLNDKYLMKYSDNGPGYRDTADGNHPRKMGLNIIQNMVRQLQAESNRYNERGAVFSILFEQKQVSVV